MSFLRRLFGGQKSPPPRIVSDPAIMGGARVIEGTRVTVAALQARKAAGESVEDILKDYPYLTRAQIDLALADGTAAPQAGA